MIGGDTSLLPGPGRSEHGAISPTGTVTAFGISSVGSMLRSGHSTLLLGNYLHILGGVDMIGSPLGPLSVVLAN